MSIQQTKKSTPAPMPTKLPAAGPSVVQIQQPKPTVVKTPSTITLTEADGTNAFVTYSFGSNDNIFSVLAIINLDRVQAGLAPLNIDDLGR